MANGYGSSSSSSSSKTTNSEGKIAPEGFHYMPDGTLMSDAEHERLYGAEAIKTRRLSGSVNQCAIFIMDTNGINYYQDISAMASPPTVMTIPPPSTWPASSWGPNDNLSPFTQGII